MKDQKQKLTGKSINAKMGAILEILDKRYYLDGLSEWADEIVGKTVTVLGRIIKRDDMPVFIFTKEMQSGRVAIPSGIPVSDKIEYNEMKWRELITDFEILTVK